MVDLPPPVLPRRGRVPSAQLDRASNASSSMSLSSPLPPMPSPPSFGSAQSDRNAFGFNLQSSYEAISKRHEEELHALESMRMHIFKRMKCDKEYSEQLFRANQSCQRIGQFTSSTTSAIVQVSCEDKIILVLGKL